jgi:aspartyl-tRNA(Asn)/glutamyl-tRNA(Gln) amidotransferase subunit A
MRGTVPAAKHFDEPPPGVFLARPAAIGPGQPLAVKDLFDTAGLTTTYGSAIFAQHVPAETAEPVRRLEAAGYANVGKTNLHEFAYGITSVNPHFGTVPNPRWPGRMAGGSSGGSAAAVAAGLAVVGLGSDSGGSIRIPAACCGLVGFKPTHGLVPLEGCFPLAPTFDHAGPIADSVEDCAAAMEALAPGFERATAEFDELRVGVAWLEHADPLVRLRIAEAAARFPHRRELELPLPQGVGEVFMREVANVHRDLFAEHADEYGADVRLKIERCLRVTDRDYERGLRAREEYRVRCEELVANLDLVIAPTLAFVAPRLPVEDREIRDATVLLTFPLNALGWPALALPCGPAEDDLPASAQLIGRPGDDALVLAVAAALESLLQASERAAAAVDH